MANTRCTAARREPFLAVCAFRICLERLSFSLGCIPSQSANLRGSKCDGSLNGSIESSIACLLHGCSKRICALASVRPCMRPRSSCQPDFGSRRQPSLISKKSRPPPRICSPDQESRHLLTTVLPAASAGARPAHSPSRTGNVGRS
jgi:hypothetical protein